PLRLGLADHLAVEAGTRAVAVGELGIVPGCLGREALKVAYGIEIIAVHGRGLGPPTTLVNGTRLRKACRGWGAGYVDAALTAASPCTPLEYPFRRSGTAVA